MIKRWQVFIILLLTSINIPFPEMIPLVYVNFTVYLFIVVFSIPIEEQEKKTIGLSLYIHAFIANMSLLMLSLILVSNVGLFMSSTLLILFTFETYLIIYKAIKYHHKKRASWLKIIITFYALIPLIGIWFLPKNISINRK